MAALPENLLEINKLSGLTRTEDITRVLREEVRGRYEHAAEVAKKNKATYSTSPLYEWANQAKISCAKSYGSLRIRWQWHKRPDFVMLQKCECFYQRMTAYLGR